MKGSANLSKCKSAAKTCALCSYRIFIHHSKQGITNLMLCQYFLVNIEIVVCVGSNQTGYRKSSEQLEDSFHCMLEKRWQKVTIGAILGQVLSFLITGTGVFSQMLSNSGVHLPTFQSFFNYVLLSLYLVVMFYRSKKGTVECFRQRGYFYACLAVLDVEANFMLVMAYQYTTISSVTLLDCFSIPCVVVLSFFFLRYRYHWAHALSIVVCLIGLATLVISDIENHSESSSSQPVEAKHWTSKLTGDMLVLGGSSLYAICNVGVEYNVRRHGNLEYMAFVGAFGAVISGIQAAILEHSALTNLDWSWEVVLMLVGFVSCLFGFYSLMPWMLSISGVTIMNLSLLTSDFYAVLANLLIFHNSLASIYFLAFGLTVGGLVAYNLVPQHRGSLQDSTECVTEEESGLLGETQPEEIQPQNTQIADV